MYNYQNSRIETKKGIFKPSSSRMVQVLRKKEQPFSDYNTAKDVVTIHRSLQRVLVKELNKHTHFEKTKFLPNSCDDQYFTAIDPIEMEDYSKIYQNVSHILEMDPVKVKKARDIAESERKEKERQQELFEQQIKQYKFQPKNIVKQRMQTILEQHNKHNNNNNNNGNNNNNSTINNAPQKEEVHLKPHDQKVLTDLNDMYSIQPNSVKNATTLQKVVNNLSQFEKTKNSLISQTKVPYQQLIKQSNNSVLMSKHRKRSNTTVIEPNSLQQGLQLSNLATEQHSDQANRNNQQNQQNETTSTNQHRIHTLSNTKHIGQSNTSLSNRARGDTIHNDNYLQMARDNPTVSTLYNNNTPPRTQRNRIKVQDLQLYDFDNQTYNYPAQSTLQSTLHQSRFKSLNQTVSPDYYSTSQTINYGSREKLKLKTSASFSRFNQKSQQCLPVKRDNSELKQTQKLIPSSQSDLNQDGFYLTQCVQKTENCDNGNAVNKNIKNRSSTVSIVPFGTAVCQQTKETKQSNTSQQQIENINKNDKQKEQKIKQRNPMKQYYDVDADNDDKNIVKSEYSIDIPFDQFSRKFNISLKSGKPKKTIISLPSLEKELRIKGIKKQQEEQQKRQKMNLNLNQLEEFKGFKFPLNEHQAIPTKTSHNTRISNGNNSNSMSNFNGNASMIGHLIGGSANNNSNNNRQNTFNLFYKGQNSIILQNRKRSPSSFQNLSLTRQDSNLQNHDQQQIGLQKQTSITLNNSVNISYNPQFKSERVSPSLNNSGYQAMQQIKLRKQIKQQNRVKLQIDQQSNDLNKSELLLVPYQQQLHAISQTADNNNILSVQNFKSSPSPQTSPNAKSKDNTTQQIKNSIFLKRDQNGKTFNLSNQVSFGPCFTPQTQISPSTSQNYFIERLSPAKSINLQDTYFQDSQQQQQQQQLLKEAKSIPHKPQEQLNVQPKCININNSKIIYEDPEMLTRAQTSKHSKTQFQFFDKKEKIENAKTKKELGDNKKNEKGEKTAEMLINEHQKIMEKIKSKKFKKLVNKTHKCEDRVIDGCRQFYVKKKEKNQELFQLFLTHHRDRPKTQEIRSRNYSCNSSESGKFNLRAAREKCENEYNQMGKQNEPQQELYRELITKLVMKSNSGDNMNICVYIMNGFKTILEDLHVFQPNHLFYLMDKVEQRQSYLYNPTTYFMIQTFLQNFALPLHELSKFKKFNTFLTYFQNIDTSEQQNTQSTINQEKQKKHSDFFQITIDDQEITINDFEDND